MLAYASRPDVGDVAVDEDPVGEAAVESDDGVEVPTLEQFSSGPADVEIPASGTERQLVQGAEDKVVPQVKLRIPITDSPVVEVLGCVAAKGRSQVNVVRPRIRRHQG